MQHQSASGRARRIVLGCAAGITVALGLGVRLLGEGTWIGPVGDALYAVLIYCLVGVLMPRTTKVRIAVAAFVVCGLIEVSHLTSSEEHTSELQSRGHLVSRLPLELKN